MSQNVGNPNTVRKTGTVTLLLVFLMAVAATGQTLPAAYAVSVEVMLGGYPVAVEMQSDGPIVQTVTDNYALSGEVKAGDVVKQVNDERVACSRDLAAVMARGNLTIPVTIKLLRRNEETTVRLMPERDVCSDKLKLGFQVKDGVSGIGTVTCLYHDRFYALGHPISDSECSSRFVCRTGEIFSCEVGGIERPSAGKTGKIIGKCTDGNRPLGIVEENSDFGLRGAALRMTGTPVRTIPREEVKPGRAQIYTTIKGQPQLYDIEIVKASKQSSPNEKGMVIHVTDEELLRDAGGILQGMSGSPILQDGKLAGAVTHVFTNDATRGYGVYSDWILAA